MTTKKKAKRALQGVLSFHSETGTEGGYWAFQDEHHIHYEVVQQWAPPHMTVYDVANRHRQGKVVKAIKADGRLLPDPIFNHAWMEAIGQNISGVLDGEAFDARMTEINAMPTYYADPDEVITMEVKWSDDSVEQRPAETLLCCRWEYAGLHYLRNGDRLTIFEKDDPTRILWQGVIQLKQHKLFTQLVFNMWIHADMKGWDREEWAKLFLDRYPAELIPR